MSNELSSETREAILEAIKSGRKIEAIKLYHDQTGAGLKESKDFIEELSRQFFQQNPDLKPVSAGCAGAILLGFVILTGTITSLIILWV